MVRGWSCPRFLKGHMIHTPYYSLFRAAVLAHRMPHWAWSSVLHGVKYGVAVPLSTFQDGIVALSGSHCKVFVTHIRLKPRKHCTHVTLLNLFIYGAATTCQNCMHDWHMMPNCSQSNGQVAQDSWAQSVVVIQDLPLPKLQWQIKQFLGRLILILQELPVQCSFKRKKRKYQTAVALVWS